MYSAVDILKSQEKHILMYFIIYGYSYTWAYVEYISVNSSDSFEKWIKSKEHFYVLKFAYVSQVFLSNIL